jgi:CarD family transcriptional regulator
VYGIGDYLVKAADGICRVDNIVHVNLSGVDSSKLYYLLVPVEEKKQKIYVPVEGSAVHVRKAMTEEEAWNFIERIPDMEEIPVESEKVREYRYKEAMKSCSPEALIGIIKLTYSRNQMRQRQGKKHTIVDERYFRMAEDTLYSELGVVLNKNKNEITQLIKNSIDKKKEQTI